MWTRKHLLGIEDLTRDEIVTVLDTADEFLPLATGPGRHPKPLAGKQVSNMFFEPSTRTSSSFSLAAKRLGADVLSFSKSVSSVTKGETLIDTVRNIKAMGLDVAIIRHRQAGAPKLVAEHVDVSVVNAGDGFHEHPTQALLDVLTIRRALGRVEGLDVAIIGDIAHSRVARSDAWALTKLGARVTFVGPPTLMPADAEALGVEVATDLDGRLDRFDVLYLLRIQLERQKAGLFPSLGEYARLFGLDRARLSRARAAALVMHPGPTNRGVEIAGEVADGGSSVILDQVACGVAVRMAVLALVCGAESQ